MKTSILRKFIDKIEIVGTHNLLCRNLCLSDTCNFLLRLLAEWSNSFMFTLVICFNNVYPWTLCRLILVFVLSRLVCPVLSVFFGSIVLFFLLFCICLLPEWRINIFIYFLRAKADTAIVRLSHRNSVCLSVVCLSHGWISQKRRKTAVWNEINVYFCCSQKAALRQYI